MILSYDYLTLFMSTLSVPLTPDLLKHLEDLVKNGVFSSKAEAARQAIKQFIEDQAVREVLEASKEPSLAGDLDELAKKL